jgi:GYD domain
LQKLAKKVGVEIKHLYLTSGDSDLVIFVDAPSGDNVAKFALAVSSQGNVRTRTVRAWSADEYRKPKSSVVRFGPKADKISGPLARQGKLVLLCNRGVRPDEHWRATRCGMVSH